MMKRQELTEKIRAVKRAKKLTWRSIASSISEGSPIVVTAALLGKMRLTPAEAEKAASILDLTSEDRDLLSDIPDRSAPAAGPPSDPLIYRFHELLSVYGTTWKALIEEDFGDGIMSAIDFTMDLERVADPNGDRVKITMSGKFLPYKRY